MATRALVLGGGGPVGIAWESGLLAGLAEAGLDLSAADFILGTSAGSMVGAWLALGRTPAEVAAPFLGSGEMPHSSSELLTEPPDIMPLVAKLMEAYAGERDPEEVRREIGAWALQSAALSEESYLSSFARNLKGLAEDFWPRRRFSCTAVDAESGEFVEWKQGAGAGLLRAVASSCAVPGIYPPVTINGRRYMDGGMRSVTNADLARGYESVVVVSVSGDSMPELFRRPLMRELDALRASGSRVEVIGPDAESLESFGPNLMDYRRRPVAASSGMRQGRMGSEAVAAVWG